MNANREKLYFGVTERGTWFGAVWRYKEGERIPIIHWYGTTEDDVVMAWRRSKWFGRCTFLFTPSPINRVYDIVDRNQSQFRHADE